MLRFATAALALCAGAQATNDYVQISAHTKVCPADSRIPLACGSCGPNWGTLEMCEDQCNAVAACTHITYFDDKGCRIYSGCANPGAASASANVDTQIYERHNAVPVPVPTPPPTPPPAPTPPPPTPPPTPVPAGGTQPCDLFDAAGTPCVAAHSVTRALYGAYSGPLYQVRKGDGAAAPSCPACATKDIGLLSTGGVVDAAAQDEFCGGEDCYISRIYDQSPRGNHLGTAPAGGCVHSPDKPVRAGALKVTVRGKPAYGAYFEGGMGYRVDKTSGVATGDDPETLYMVVSGRHYNGGCCFDYGNAETDNNDDGKGTMESIYFGNSTGWSKGTGSGPWVMADIENGLWAGSEAVNPNAPPLHHDFVTGMVKGDSENHFALKAGDANTRSLLTTHDGVRPPGYQVMKKQGAIILGIGGDNSDSAIGTWFEGVMTSGYSTNAADDLVQANIAAAAYTFV